MPERSGGLDEDMNSNLVCFMERMPEKVDAAIIQSNENRYYLTGFQSSAGIIFATREKSYFIIDFRYIEAARCNVKDCEVVLLENSIEQLNALIKKHNVSVIGIENDRMNVYEFKKLRKELHNCEILDCGCISRELDSMRMIKSPYEIELIKQAQDLTARTFLHVLDFIKCGKTEKEIALEMEFFIRKCGADSTAFDFIVVSGAKTSLPHGTPGEKVIYPGDFITMDFGACVCGYRSDMTRTVAVSKVTDEQRAVYDIVLKAQSSALKEIRSGMKCSDVDRIARDIIYNSGYTGCFGHGLGHSVGIEIHESPSLSPRCDNILKPGIVTTVEPGIYIEGRFGVRIEDLVVVTESGCENLTNSEKSLIIL